jgi:hypothetical protein
MVIAATEELQLSPKPLAFDKRRGRCIDANQLRRPSLDQRRRERDGGGLCERKPSREPANRLANKKSA